MTTPRARLHQLLQLAEWRYPDGEWKIIQREGVFSEKYGFFDLGNAETYKKLVAKINLSGWNIRSVKRGGQEHWRAEKGGSSTECPVLLSLLVDVVERIERDKK